ncbi:MAG: response regulator [Bacillota bacterium]
MNNGMTLSIVVVEDSRFYADLIVRILKRSGLNVRSKVVSSMTALYKTLNEDKWDIILSDNVMPEFSALGALNVKNEICSKTPFFIISEDISQKELDEAFENGCDFYLPKDKIEELPDQIKIALNINGDKICR